MNHGSLKPFALALVLLLAPGALGAQDAKDTKTKKQAAPAAGAKTDINPFIAAQVEARSKALKVQKKVKPIPASQRVDINSATKEQLKKLPGVTEVYADKIIAGRPYLTKIHLVNHDVLPFALYESLKGRIVARQKDAKFVKK